MTAGTEKARLIILADMGNEPDEEQQMVHMLVCSNEFHLAGLIAVTGKYLRTAPQPELFRNPLDGYEMARFQAAERCCGIRQKRLMFDC